MSGDRSFVELAGKTSGANKMTLLRPRNRRNAPILNENMGLSLSKKDRNRANFHPFPPHRSCFPHLEVPCRRLELSAKWPRTPQRPVSQSRLHLETSRCRACTMGKPSRPHSVALTPLPTSDHGLDAPLKACKAAKTRPCPIL